MNRSSPYFKIFLICFYLVPIPLIAQDKLQWKEIELTDTLAYTSFGVDKVDNMRYPPSQLFDGDFTTCWVSHIKDNEVRPDIYVKLPSNASILNLFAGYGKTRNLFYQNSIPKKIKLSIWGGINPDGYVSEITTLYKALKFPTDTVVYIKDSFDVQSIPLNISQEKLRNFKDYTSQAYANSFNIPQAEFCFILQMEILDAWPGTKYDDVCISELFFNDRLVETKSNTIADTLYVNKEQNTLMAELQNEERFALYINIDAVVQIGEISNNKKWVILLSTPSQIEGRAEVSYLLVNIPNKEIVNEKLKQYSKDYVVGAPIYFEEASDHQLFLVFESIEGSLGKIELIDP